ncbi:MAG: hypothetical protein V4726_17275 [Verrucomicrobiota bacterium]
MKTFLAASTAGLALAASASASTTLHSLVGGNFSQDWSNITLVSTNDDWNGVPSIVGYRGDDLTIAIGTDPQTITASDTLNVIDVIANQTNPNTVTSGGVAEFEIGNPVVALQGSGTADAPYLMLYLDATGVSTINISYNLVDIDGSTDNSVQPFALQYRVGGTGDFINLSGGYVADASSGPSLATLVTPVSVTLPANANGASQLEVRIMTTNAPGSDEWVGIDDILVTSVAVPEPAAGVLGLLALGALSRRRRG